MLDRRTLLASLAALAVLPRPAIAQAPRVRLPWPDFRAGPQFAPFVAAVRTMRANSNAADPASWQFWANVHQGYCPHGRPYFLGWHRAYLALFEQQLQRISGVADLTLPYWDYYSASSIPADFTQAAAGNPLFNPRPSTQVGGALAHDAFAPAIVNFHRGASRAFEPILESYPHNRVHSLIGGDMVTLQSPRDPIFWLHHANIDRLWSAWVAAGSGRTMPAKASAYWDDSFVYAPGLTAPRRSTYDTVTAYDYRYDDESLPQPPSPIAPPRPPFKSLGPFMPSGVRPNFFALGAGGSLSLGAEDFSVQVPVAPGLRGRLAPLLTDVPSTSPIDARSLAVVLDDVRLTPAGSVGGYFYKVYVNLPASGEVADERHWIGDVTPFQIATAGHGAEDGAHDSHEPVRIVLPATEVLRRLPPQDLGGLTVSFVRIEGDAAPAETAIEIRNFRIEASTAPVE